MKVERPDSNPAGLVAISRSDAPASGVNHATGGPVHGLVHRRHYMGGETDLYPPGGIDTKLAQLVQLFNECDGVHYHPGTEQTGAARMQDAGGQLVQDKGLVFYFDGVPGIGATLVARSEVHLIAERVDDLALALVAPLPANHCCYRHSYDPVSL